MVMLVLLGCVHQVSWTVQPLAAYDLKQTEVAVVAAEPGCRALADALVNALGSRPEIVVRPDAAQRLTVHRCDEHVTTSIDIEGNYPGLDYGTSVYQERRRYSLNGDATGEMVVDGLGVEPVKFSERVEREIRGAWVDEGSLDIPASMQLRERLATDLADVLADKIAPLPETIRRSIYADPEPGTSRQLHNEAVAAERAGNLDEAMRLARQAYAAQPSPAGMDYIEALSQHAAQVNYAFKGP